MNWKNEAADKLDRYEAMRASLVNLPEELRRLEQEAEGLRAVDTEKLHVVTSGSSNDRLLNNLVRRQELQQILEQTQSWVRSMDRALGVLEPNERLLLERMYIQPGKGGVQWLCRELDCEVSSVYRRRDKALHKFTLALYGTVES